MIQYQYDLSPKYIIHHHAKLDGVLFATRRHTLRGDEESKSSMSYKEGEQNAIMVSFLFLIFLFFFGFNQCVHF